MTISSQVKDYILQNFLFTSDTDAIKDDDSLLDRGLIDSTGILELVTFVEETFGLKVADNDLVPENFDSVSNIAKFVESKQKA